MTPRIQRRPKENLSRVYLDDYPITLMGDEATPPLSRIIRAGGKKPDRVDVIYLTSPADRKGRAVDPETIIDRTAEPTRPIYLRTVPKEKPVMTADRPDPLLVRDPPSAPGMRDTAPDVDPVISRLGGALTADRADHEEGVFRSPSQQADDDVEALVKLRAATHSKPGHAAGAKAAAEKAEGEARRGDDADADAEPRT